MTAIPPRPVRTFVPVDLDTASFAAIEPLFLALEDRLLRSAAELERWLLDGSELGAVLSEVGTRRYVDMTCHTDDPAIEAAYLQWIEKIQPACKPHGQRLDEKFLACPHRRELPAARYHVYDRNTANDVALSASGTSPCRPKKPGSTSSSPKSPAP